MKEPVNLSEPMKVPFSLLVLCTSLLMITQSFTKLLSELNFIMINDQNVADAQYGQTRTALKL